MPSASRERVNLSLHVGHDAEAQSQQAADSGLDQWLQELNQSIDAQQKTGPTTQTLGVVSLLQPKEPEAVITAATASTSHVDYQAVCRVFLMQIRDAGHRRLTLAWQRLVAPIQPQPTSGGGQNQWEPALGPHEFDDLQTALMSHQIPVQSYYQLQQELSTLLRTAETLQRQWHEVPAQPTEVPHTRTMLQTLFQTLRDSNVDQLTLLRTNAERVWKLRSELVEAYQLLVTDTVREFEGEGQRILEVYSQVRSELDRQIQASEDHPFLQNWKRVYENFRHWVQSIAAVLPPSLQFQQEVDGFLMVHDTAEDPCCLKRVRHLRDQLQRIHSVLSMHRQSEHHQRMQSSALHEELKMATAEWSQTQSQLDAVQRELQTLATRRVAMWSQNTSVTELEAMERRQAELEQRQAQLTERIGPLRMAMERVRQQNGDVLQSAQVNEALQQAEEWKRKFETQQAECEREAQTWTEGRGVQYRARETVVAETLRTLEALRVTAQQKIDGAGVALVRYGLLMMQQVMASAEWPVAALQRRQDAAQTTLAHHTQRMALNQPALAELLHRQAQTEADMRKTRTALEELQTQNTVLGLLQRVFQSVKAV